MRPHWRWGTGPCDHKGCQSHVTHPCEGCGRQWDGKTMNSPLTLVERARLIQLVKEDSCGVMPALDSWYTPEEIANTFEMLDTAIAEARAALNDGWNSVPEQRKAREILEKIP